MLDQYQPAPNIVGKDDEDTTRLKEMAVIAQEYKSALNAITVSFAKELAVRGVRVNAAAPATPLPISIGIRVAGPCSRRRRSSCVWQHWMAMDQPAGTLTTMAQCHGESP
jgi:NAD(P)-dependent dehydrogenase (short-subunit alcohol dehydrogenase family)